MTKTKLSFAEFETLYNEKVVPDFSTLSSDELTNQILYHENKYRDIDWLKAANEGEVALGKAYKTAFAQLNNAVKSLTPDEIISAKRIGLIDSAGNIALTLPLKAGSATGAPVPFPDGAPSYTVWGWNAETVQKYKSARGRDVEKYIKNLVANFQVMAQDDDVGIVKILMGAGAFAFGTVAIVAVINIIKTLVVVSQATEAYAVLEGVLTVGVNIIRLAISTVILAIIVPLMILMAKDAFGLFVLINNTASPLVMNDITFTHGKCVSGFKQDASADNPQAIIPEVFEVYNPNTQKTYSAISAGFLGVRKRDNALIGPRGALSFASTTEFPQGAFLGWEIPLAIGSNRLLVSATYAGSVSDFSDKADDDGVLDSQDTSSAGTVVQGHMSGAGGSEAYAFVSFG